MEHQEALPSGDQLPWSTWLGAVWSLTRIRLRERATDTPGMVAVTRRSQELAERAGGLAGAGREDADAAAELRTLAGGHRGSLELATRRWQVDGLHQEQQLNCRAVRLLQAAAADGRVQPEPEELGELFDCVEELGSQPDEEAFSTLALLDARLERIRKAAASGQLRDEAVISAAAAGADLDWVLCKRIWSDLGAYLGHRAPPSALPLLRTQAAFLASSRYLLSLVGVEG